MTFAYPIFVKKSLQKSTLDYLTDALDVEVTSFFLSAGSQSTILLEDDKFDVSQIPVDVALSALLLLVHKCACFLPFSTLACTSPPPPQEQQLSLTIYDDVQSVYRIQKIQKRKDTTSTTSFYKKDQQKHPTCCLRDWFTNRKNQFRNCKG